jgi:hypothetical protein
MVPAWEYLCTSNAHDAATLTRHMNNQAANGWELLAVTFAIKGESGVHVLFWRRRLDSAPQQSAGSDKAS